MNLSETTQKEQVLQVDVAGVNSIWNSFFERILNNEETSETSDSNSKEITSIDNDNNSKSISTITNNEFIN